MSTPPDLETFERAFTSHCAGCLRQCECGRQFYDADNIYSWEEGELEKLLADPKAVALEYAVETMSLEGREYVLDCSCWHERAKHIKGFIDSHARSIAEYLKLEKERKQRLADESPTVDP